MTREELLQIAKPILFNTEMVKAILDGRKAQTRRIRNIPPFHFDDCLGEKIMEYSDGAWYCGVCGGDGLGYQYGHPPKSLFPQHNRGDILYVRETWQYIEGASGCGYAYKAGGGVHNDTGVWRPSIHMPKEAARIFLRVTDVRCERLQEISIADIKREGVVVPKIDVPEVSDEAYLWFAFQTLWDSTVNKADVEKYGWNANPWVWVYGFELVYKEDM